MLWTNLKRAIIVVICILMVILVIRLRVTLVVIFRVTLMVRQRGEGNRQHGNQENRKEKM